MSKYKFNNWKVEDAIKTLCEELGIDDLDRCIEMSFRHGLNVFCQVDGKTVLEFSGSLVNPVAFDPNGWNDGDVIPDQEGNLPDVMLIEDMYGDVYKGFWSRKYSKWVNCTEKEIKDVRRYRIYPNFLDMILFPDVRLFAGRV